ncbi:MAG: hypothetical protein KME29_12125 [Calothrix sp. FI2-JRJ7]|nr:hypothetical protein [Calothrix sp. FI2-JRJ7]
MEEAGYKTQVSFETDNSGSVSLKVVVKKANIILENNHLIIDLNMRIVAPSPSEAPMIEDKNSHNGKIEM